VVGHDNDLRGEGEKPLEEAVARPAPVAPRRQSLRVGRAVPHEVPPVQRSGWEEEHVERNEEHDHLWQHSEQHHQSNVAISWTHALLVLPRAVDRGVRVGRQKLSPVLHLRSGFALERVRSAHDEMAVESDSLEFRVPGLGLCRVYGLRVLGSGFRV